MQAHVGTENAPVIVHAEKVRELAGTAAHFQHQSPLRNLLSQKPREHTPGGLLHQRLFRIYVVIVRKGILLIKGLHDIRDITLLLLRIVRSEQLRNPAIDVESLRAALAMDLLSVRTQVATAIRTGQDVDRPLKQGLRCGLGCCGCWRCKCGHLHLVSYAICLSTIKLPRTRASISLLENVLNALAGVFTMGSPFKLNEVFRITGTPVACPKRSISL